MYCPCALKVAESARHHRIARQIARGTSRISLRKTLDHGTHRRPIAAGGVEAAADRDMPTFAGLQIMAGAAVIVVGMRHRPHDAELVGHLCQARQMLAHQQPRRAARRRSKRPPNLRDRVGLHVKRLKLARAAEQKHEDHRFGPASALGAGAHLRMQQARQREAHQPGARGLQDFAARPAVTHGSRSAQD